MRVLVALVVVKLLLHVAANLWGGYEFHRDEFLYMAMGDHLRLFAMDFPPAIAITSKLARAVFGDSLLAIRLVPAVLSIVVLALAVLAARDLGGGWFAQFLAGLAVLLSPLFLRTGNLFQPVVLDQLWWTAALFALLQVARRGDPRWWLVFGTACGLGLLSKFSMLVFGFGALVAILLTKERKALRTRWPWLAALLAFVIGSPSFVGQIQLDWPLFVQMGDLRQAQLSRVTPLGFLGGQVGMHGASFFLAVVGAAALLAAPRFRAVRLVGWTCVASFVVLLVLKGKPYYAGPVYPVLFAAGAVEVERFRLARWGAMVARAVVLASIVVFGAVSLPLGLPIVPPEPLERYLGWLGNEDAVTTNRGATERLPQDYADMLGWEELVREVTRVYESLEPADRARAVLFASNYGEAGAIDFYGARFGLPKAVSIVGTYWFFGPGDLPGDVTIAVGFDVDDLVERFASVEQVGFYSHPYGVEEQRNNTILLARDPHDTFQELWPGLAGRN